MPMKAPRICGCGLKVAAGIMCACQIVKKRLRDQRHNAIRPNARERGYDRNWQRESKKYLVENPRCLRCAVPATVVDHIQAHKGNLALFWNKANWQPLCAHCHSCVKQAQEHREAKR